MCTSSGLNSQSRYTPAGDPVHYSVFLFTGLGGKVTGDIGQFLTWATDLSSL